MGFPAIWKPKNEKDNLPRYDWIEFFCCAEPARSGASGTLAARSLRGFFNGASSTGKTPGAEEEHHGHVETEP